MLIAPKYLGSICKIEPAGDGHQEHGSANYVCMPLSIFITNICLR